MSFKLSAMATKGYTLARYEWSTTKQPNAVLLIIHGMAEYAERYNHFAAFLCEHNIAVYAHDHRGHGRSAPSDSELGHVGKGGWQSMVEDIEAHIQLIKKEHPNTPVFVHGHSMGSFMLTEHLIQFGDGIKGVIFSGSCGKPPSKSKPGRIIARIERLRKGGRGFSSILKFLVFGGYTKHLPDKRTESDWLSSDKAVVDAYIDDPRCGFQMDIQFWVEFLDGLAAKSKPERMANIPKSVNFFIISGTDCPVGERTIGVKRLISELTAAGIRDIKYLFYNKMRHEILNEINKEKVYDDILSWINSQQNMSV